MLLLQALVQDGGGVPTHTPRLGASSGLGGRWGAGCCCPHGLPSRTAARKWPTRRCCRNGCAWPAAATHTPSSCGATWSPSGPCRRACWTTWSTSPTATATRLCTTLCLTPTSPWCGSCLTVVSRGEGGRERGPRVGGPAAPPSLVARWRRRCLLRLLRSMPASQSGEGGTRPTRGPSVLKRADMALGTAWTPSSPPPRPEVPHLMGQDSGGGDAGAEWGSQPERREESGH